jgi:hypothetical protein
MARRLISNKALWGMHVSQGRAEEISAWAQANGLRPRDVSVDHDIVIDGAVIRFHVYLRNDRGSKYSLTGDALAVEERTAPLTVEPPDGWPVYALTDRKESTP